MHWIKLFHHCICCSLLTQSHTVCCSNMNLSPYGTTVIIKMAIFFCFSQAAKICNNLLLAVSMIGVSEATNLAIRLGLDPEMIAKVINSSSGRCWSSDTYNPCPGIIEGIPSSNNYQGGFASQLMVKVGLLASFFCPLT